MTQPLDASLAAIAAGYAAATQAPAPVPQAYLPQPQPAVAPAAPEGYYLASDNKYYPLPAPQAAPVPPPPPAPVAAPPAPPSPSQAPQAPQGFQIPAPAAAQLVQTLQQQALPINPPEAAAALGATEPPKERKRGKGKAASPGAAAVPPGAQPGSVDLCDFNLEDLVTQIRDRGFKVTLERL